MSRQVLLLVAVVVAAVFIGLATRPSVAHAGTIRCSTFRCANHYMNAQSAKIKTLQAQVAALQTKLTSTRTVLAGFLNCMNEVPLTQYGDTGGTFGYVFDDGGTFDTTGLDFTQSGEIPDSWVMWDQCNTSVASAPFRSPSGILVRPFSAHSAHPLMHPRG